MRTAQQSAKRLRNTAAYTPGWNAHQPPPPATDATAKSSVFGSTAATSLSTVPSGHHAAAEIARERLAG